LWLVLRVRARIMRRGGCSAVAARLRRGNSCQRCLPG
jgi:hypothetical protein